ncbi:hypothetical protein VB620_17940 [Nodularia harveyana UHCC-0300]|uniref:Uncharacterized protein n=1 Tax=Nodularia harveyana UHCC-0300 TaxID=2974287 RepID=A0ABU5UJF7_9CYAN|nr:hypothetical protein [Nodularia harveyana]MEA5583215.1 hypothetical protein [Nodularia harveyana UHCC-0300]
MVYSCDRLIYQCPLTISPDSCIIDAIILMLKLVIYGHRSTTRNISQNPQEALVNAHDTAVELFFPSPTPPNIY